MDAARGRLSIALGVLDPPPVTNEGDEPLKYIFPKPGSNPPAFFSASQIISNCEVRGSKYLIESVAVNARNWSVLTTDAEIQHQSDLSFISIGLLNNHKTMGLLANPANTLVDFNVPRFTSKVSGRLLIQNNHAAHDHGLILKINPSNHPHRTWICCAGLGEWGTSAAAWYLARRWRKIMRNSRTCHLRSSYELSPAPTIRENRLSKGRPQRKSIDLPADNIRRLSLHGHRPMRVFRDRCGFDADYWIGLMFNQ